MLEQDADCHIVNTASLAGLISLPGSGIYSVTKHGVVTMSEILYHELNQIEAKVQVSVLCPAGVSTRIGESSRNRPEDTSDTSQVFGSGPSDSELGEKWWQRIWEEALEPKQVAESVFNAIRNERFYILTHPEYNETIRVRLEDILDGRNPTNPYTVPVS
jgi:short-subunit dehydrogenase